MKSTEAHQAVLARWLARWPSRAPGVPWTFDNLGKPDGPILARVAITSVGSEQHTLGPPGKRQWLRSELIDVRLTGPINQGRRQLDELAQHVREIYEGVRFGNRAGERGIVTYATTVNELKRDKESNQLWILSVVTPFDYIEVR